MKADTTIIGEIERGIHGRLYVQNLRAPNTPSGNPRRCWVVYKKTGTVVAIFDEGFIGRPSCLVGSSELMGLDISAKTYRELKKKTVWVES